MEEGTRNGLCEDFIMKKKPKMLVVGSLIMDQTATTRVFPRDGQTVLGKEYSQAPGGKGANQAVQMARLGIKVSLIGKVGRDTDGEKLLCACAEAGVDTSMVLQTEEEPTGRSMIILEMVPGENTKNRILVVPGANMAIRPEEIKFLKETIQEYDMVLLQNEIPMEINEIVAAYAFEKGVPVMLNPAPAAQLSKEFISHLTYISPNEQETEDMTGIECHMSNGEFHLEKAKVAATILKGYGIKNVLLTLSEAGALLDTPDGRIYKPAAKHVKIVDPTAAGDAFVGAFCTRICMGDSLGKALEYANDTAALAVTKMGAMPSLPTLEEVQIYLETRGL